jgi:hypothetical protein
MCLPPGVTSNWKIRPHLQQRPETGLPFASLLITYLLGLSAIPRQKAHSDMLVRLFAACSPRLVQSGGDLPENIETDFANRVRYSPTQAAFSQDGTLGLVG